MDFLWFVLAIAIGGVASWQIFAWVYRKKLQSQQQSISSESTVLLERIEKVFKVVLAEGYFTEIYDHNTKRDIWGIFETNNKALVIAKAKVAVGYDFVKMKFRQEPDNKKLIVDEFAPAEILSIDTDYKFYDINQGLLSKFNNEDYTRILAETKKLMREKAGESDLPQIAANQVSTMIKQLAASMNWEVDMKVLENSTSTPKLLPEKL